ncbi:MAG: diacylglycerol/lipid kinase family protein [Gemmatimonadaceae bacterium]
MRVTALYNPEAGGGTLTRGRLRTLLERGGFDATYHSAKAPAWKRVLDDPGDMVVVAGGDGTIAKVAKRLAGRGVPLAILPGGTANNIARSLGLESPLDELVTRWRDAEPTPVDLGLICAPWGEDLFIEATGLGVFPRMLEIAAARERMTPPERLAQGQMKTGIDLMVELVMSSRARRWKVTLDGRDHSGDYIMLEALNIRYIGGGIELAPTADVADGMLDVMAVREEDRGLFIEYLRELRDGRPERTLTTRARRIEIDCAETSSHVDDEPWPARRDKDPESGLITIDVQPGAIEVLL